MNGGPSELSYPELTEPLRALTRENARFIRGEREMSAFKEIKRRLCSDRVLVPYDTRLNTWLYVDSSHIRTQVKVAQCHTINGEKFWRTVNHTLRAWTPAESGYGQVERGSNGILTGMYMNKMYTLGTHVQVVTDHQPLTQYTTLLINLSSFALIITESNYSPSNMMWCMNLVKKHHVTMGPITLQSVPNLMNSKSKNGALRLGQIYTSTESYRKPSSNSTRHPKKGKFKGQDIATLHQDSEQKQLQETS